MFRLDFYTQNDIEQILRRSARLLDVAIDEDAIRLIASRSRFTPRIANRLLKRARDYVAVHNAPAVTDTLAQEALELLEIDHKGLESLDIKILNTIIRKFSGGPVGVQTLAASVMEETETIEDVYEPYLMQIGFLHRTPRGRVATPRA